MELHKKNLIDSHKLLTANFSLLTRLIRSSGYFTQKAKKLKIFSRFVQGEAKGNLLNLKTWPLARLRSRLLNLWGVGPETADSILLYALNKPVFVIDAYTRRIGERLGWNLPKDYEGIREFFESSLPKSALLFNEFHALLVRLAKERCLKNNPLCSTCPLISRCSYANFSNRG